MDNAKSLIKKYYQRVTYANRNFTCFKEGWKTDRGLVYVVFGPPHQVLEFDSRIEWVYNASPTQRGVTFEFYPKKNLFCDEYFELGRSINYKNYWYDQVDLWRKGSL